MPRIVYVLLFAGVSMLPLFVLAVASRPPGTTTGGRTYHRTYFFYGSSPYYGHGGWLGSSFARGHGEWAGGSSAYSGGGPRGGK